MKRVEDIVDDFLELARPLARSVSLIGSQCTGDVSVNSDIDIIAIGQPTDELRDSARRVCSEQMRNGRSVLDVKVYSISEFHEKMAWVDNFYLWACAQNRQVLFGDDLLDSVYINMERVDDLVWKEVIKFNQVLDWLERSLHYTGACCYSVEVLTTFYFIQRYFLNKNLVTLGTKRDYLQMNLGNEFNKVINVYYETMKLHPGSEVGQVISISGKQDRKFTPENYMKLLSRVREITPLIDDIRVQVKRRVEIASDNL